MFYINGEYVSDEEAKISVLDLGLVRGYGVFDYLRTYHGRPFHLWEHLLRLNYSAEQVAMQLPCPLKEIEEIVLKLMEKNQYPESSIKIILTGGISPDQITPQERASLIVLVHPLKDLPQHFYKEGITATTTSLSRSFPQVKTLQYLPAIIALKKGRSKNAQEALFLNAKNEILEATTSNFFAFTADGKLVTCASEEILYGITREVVLKIAAPHFPISIRAIHYEEIGSIAEAFITSSNKEVLPVTRIDDTSIGDGKVGPLTKRLMELFKEYTSQSIWDPLTIDRYETDIKLDFESIRSS